MEPDRAHRAGHAHALASLDGRLFRQCSDERTAVVITAVAGSHSRRQDAFHALEIDDTRANPLEMCSGEITRALTGSATAVGKLQQGTYFLKRKPEFARSTNEAKTPDIFRAEVPIPAMPPGPWSEAYALVIANRLDIAARAPGEFANRNGLWHGRHRILSLSL